MGELKATRCCIAASLIAACFGSASTSIASPTYEYFDPGIPKEFELSPSAINNSGVIVGTATAGNRIRTRGFIRNVDGTIEILDGGGGILALDINDAGRIVGQRGLEGFLREPDGKIVKFQASGAVATTAYSINAGGDCVGSYVVNGGISHAFFRSTKGKIQNIDAADGPIHQEAVGINKIGDIIGRYYDTMWHGFLRDTEGNITIIDPPEGANGIYLMGLNNQTASTGFYYGSDSLTHAFVRSSDGILTAFDVPGASETLATRINNEGAVTGYFDDAAGVHGFFRSPEGTITLIDVPVKNSGTSAIAINDANEITGTYSPNGHNTHPLGFLRHP